MWKKWEPKRSATDAEAQLKHQGKQAVTSGGEGNWTWWETTIERKPTWSTLWVIDDGKPQFLLGAVVNLLHSLSNL